MRAVLLGCGLALAASSGFAHRLDEYLQATRIAVSTNRIDLTFELTPGVAVAGKVIERMDLDRNGRISNNEQSAYARQFLKDLTVKLDGNAMALNLTAVSASPLDEMRKGTGVIRMSVTSPAGSLRAGDHTLSLTNAHLPDLSVYLVNALQSRDPAVEIGQQTRDELQKEYQLLFRVR
jgi:hypothetical protein